MWKGAFSGCRGVAGQLCSIWMRKVPSCHSVPTVRTGVPAWAYQRRNWSKSMPLASSIAATKSSVVTAWPSWRSKYRSVPLRKPSRPTRRAAMPTTSAPFS